MNHGHNPAHDPASAHPAEGHETRDVRPRLVVIYAVTLTIILVVVHFGLLAAYYRMERQRPPEPVVNAPVNIYEQLQSLRRSEDETLSTYGWVDRNAGIVRIPIDRAMDLAATRGVPRGKGPRTEAELISHHGTPPTAEQIRKAEEAHQPEAKKSEEPKSEAKKSEPEARKSEPEPKPETRKTDEPATRTKDSNP